MAEASPARVEVRATHFGSNGELITKPVEQQPVTQSKEKPGFLDKFGGWFKKEKQELSKPEGPKHVLESIQVADLKDRLSKTSSQMQEIARVSTQPPPGQGDGKNELYEYSNIGFSGVNISEINRRRIERGPLVTVPPQLSEIITQISGVGAGSGPDAIHAMQVRKEEIVLVIQNGLRINLRLPQSQYFEHNNKVSFTVDAGSFGNNPEIHSRVSLIQERLNNQQSLLGISTEIVDYAQAVVEKLPEENAKNEALKPKIQSESLQAQESDPTLGIDELPEVKINSEEDLRNFLSMYRTAIKRTAPEMGWDDDMRCGLTSILIMRALHGKENITGIQQVGLDRLGSDYSGVAESVLKDIDRLSKDTGESPKRIKDMLKDLYSVGTWAAARAQDVPGSKFEDVEVQEYLTETIDDISPRPSAEAIERIKAYLAEVVSKNPQDMENYEQFVNSGWGHQVVMLETQFPGAQSESFIVDANAEQYGREFDRLFFFPIDEATSESYLLESTVIPPRRVEESELDGDIAKYTKVPTSTNSFKIETSALRAAEVSRSIAQQYRKLIRR